jgi:type II secretory pathway pseudopilin PulG
MTEPKSKGARSVALMVSIGATVLILCLAGVAAISAPKFMRFQDRSRQSECKAQLRAVAVAEQALYAENQRYTTRWAELNLSVEKGNRYQYRVGPGPLAEEGLSVDVLAHPAPTPPELDDAIPREVRAELGLKGTCPACVLTASCVGNLDDDLTLDVWSVTLSFKKEPGGYSASGGFPVNLVDDNLL